MKLAVGQKFAGYDILSVLGQGGMGTVYQAREKGLQRIVALKVLSTDLASDAKFIERFLTEARVAASLDHPNVARVYTAGQHSGVYYIAMEFIQGATLEQRLQAEGRMDSCEALAICVHVVEALSYAWRKAKIIHRDIKPDNVLLTDAGEVKVVDLGLAKRVGSPSSNKGTGTGMAVGTPHFISPEQAQAKTNIDFRTDIYSLGCMLYRMLTGKYPYDGPDQMAITLQQVNSPPPAILKEWPTCPMPLVFLLGKMVAKQPKQRHQSYDELINEIYDVNEWLVTGGVPRVRSTKMTAVVAHSKHKRLKRQLFTLLGGAIALISLWLALRALVIPEDLIQGFKNMVPPAHRPPPAATPPASATVTVIPSTENAGQFQPSINLLPLIQPARDSLAGEWKLNSGELVSDERQSALLELPYQPPAEYDFLVEFTRLSDNRGVLQILSSAGHPVAWKMSPLSTKSLFGFFLIKGNPAVTEVPGTEALLHSRRITSVIQVRKGSIRALLNGLPLLEVTTSPEPLGIEPKWQLRNPNSLGVGSVSSLVIFHKIEVQEITGKGRLTQ